MGPTINALRQLFLNLDGSALNFTVKELVAVVGIAEDPHEFINVLLYDLKAELGSVGAAIRFCNLLSYQASKKCD